MVQLNYLETAPSEKIDNLMIFIHGYGANGRDLISLSGYFEDILTNFHAISPNAPHETGMMPDSYFWFPIESFDEEHLNDGLNYALPILDNFIKNISQKYNLKNENITLCGFSQGSLLAIHAALNNSEKFKAVLSFSGGALPSIEIKNQTPICLIHGADDQVLAPEYSLMTAENFKIQNHPHQLKIIPNLEHSINKEGLDFAREFLMGV